jgi:hypothetical protein
MLERPFLDIANLQIIPLYYGINIEELIYVYNIKWQGSTIYVHTCNIDARSVLVDIDARSTSMTSQCLSAAAYQIHVNFNL